MRQTFINLIDNCFRYCEKHGLDATPIHSDRKTVAEWISKIVQHAEDHSENELAETVMDADHAFACDIGELKETM